MTVILYIITTLLRFVNRHTMLLPGAGGGRPVIRINANNLVSEHGLLHDVSVSEPSSDASNNYIEISYDVPAYRFYCEPLMIVLLYVSLFIMCSIIVRINWQ